MNHRLSLIAIVLGTACALSACSSPNYTMGPESARYVSGTYRHRMMMEEAAAAEAAAADPYEMTDPYEMADPYEMTEATANPYVARPVAAPQAVAPPQPVRITHAAAPGAPRAVIIPAANAPVAARQPVAAPAPVPAAPVAAPVPQAAAPVAATPQPTRSTQPRTPTARRFVRLKISGMDSVESDPMEVRQQLRAAQGVKEVVLSFKTKTAIVVVDKDTTAESIIGSLSAPYSAELMN